MSNVAEKQFSYLVFNHYGVHHSNWFDVNITIPSKVTEYIANKNFGLNNYEIVNLLNQYCLNVTFPTHTLITNPVYLGGEGIEVPQQRVYNPITTTFYVSGGSGITYRLFVEWMNYIFHPDSRVFSYYEDFVSPSVRITAHGGYGGFEKGKTTKNLSRLNTVVLNDAYPSDVQSINMDGNSGNTATTFVVSWKYRNISTLPENSTNNEATNNYNVNTKLTQSMNNNPPLEWI